MAHVVRTLFLNSGYYQIMSEIVSVLDTETTGLGRGREIVEIGILTIEYVPVFGPGWGVKEEFKEYRRETVTEWSSLVRAGTPIDPRAEAVHGISDADLVNAPRIQDLESAIFAILARSDFIAGHNLPFDFWMLNRDLPGLQWDDLPRLDTLALQRQHGIDYGGGLPACLSRGNIELPSGENAHRALTDAKLSAQILDKIVAQTGLRFTGLTQK